MAVFQHGHISMRGLTWRQDAWYCFCYLVAEKTTPHCTCLNVALQHTFLFLDVLYCCWIVAQHQLQF